MKNVLTYILLIAIIYDISGYYVHFRILQNEIRKEVLNDITAKLNSSDLTIIRVMPKDKSAIRWIRENKEFIYNQEMYDVVKTKTENGTVYYYCINDSKEKQLISDFDKLSKKKTDASKSKSLIKSYNPQFYFFQTPDIQHFVITSEIHFQVPVHFYKSATRDILTPPPEDFCLA